MACSEVLQGIRSHRRTLLVGVFERGHGEYGPRALEVWWCGEGLWALVTNEGFVESL